MPLVAHPPGPPPRPGPADLAAARAHILAARPGDAPHEAHRAKMLAFVAATQTPSTAPAPTAT